MIYFFYSNNRVHKTNLRKIDVFDNLNNTCNNWYLIIIFIGMDIMDY